MYDMNKAEAGMPGIMGGRFGLRVIASVIYTLASVFIKAGGSFDSGGV